MNAEELLEKYKAGDRDFDDVYLRILNFKWADLSEISLRRADLTGCDLSQVNLSEANIDNRKF